MNCMVCYVHLKKKKPCSGCLYSDVNKPERCKNCEIKNCAQEKDSLLKLLKELKDLGNTVIVVEHDKRFIQIADEIIELGPEGGPKSGEIFALGSPQDIKMNGNSKISNYLH